MEKQRASVGPWLYSALAGFLVAGLLIPYGRVSVCGRGHGPTPSPRGCTQHVKSSMVRYPDDRAALWALVAIALALLLAFVTYKLLRLARQSGSPRGDEVLESTRKEV